MLWLMMILSAASPPQAKPPWSPSCEYDRHALDLGFEAFDQDMKGGWRALADQHGCEEKAATVIRNYRQKYQSVIPLLYWHEAQIRASIGETKQAVALMSAAHEPVSEDQSGWNPYVDATIAFLRNDKGGFLRARARLEHFEKPASWPADAEWPQNWDVVSGLGNCFGKPYQIAYGSSCRPSGE